MAVPEALISPTGSFELPVARDRDLKLILEDIGLLHLLESEQLLCLNCGTRLNWDNLGALVVRGSEIHLYCELPDCLEQASRPLE